MTLGLVLKLLHVLSAVLFIGGILGRAVTFRRSAQSGELHSAYALLQASEFFERKILIPASMAALVTGLLTAWIQGWPLFGFLQNARTNWLLLSLVLFLATTPAIPLYLIPRRVQRTQAAEAAREQGKLTPELTAALNDRGVLTYRSFELAIAILIVILMVTKPF
jgi:uncharacterized membrane protein